MNGKSPDSMQERVKNWLIEEGYIVRPQNDPNASFNLFTEFPGSKLGINVAQSLHGTDGVNIAGYLDFPAEPLRRLLAMPQRERANFLWDLRFSLTLMDVQFQMAPSADNPKALIISCPIWYDGLTKDRFMTAVERVGDGMVLALLKFERAFSATTS